MANQSHKRETNARRKPKAALVAGPLAFLATASVVGLGVLASSPQARDLVATGGAASSISTAGDTRSRVDVVSRSDSRREAAQLQQAFDLSMSRTATLRAIRKADTQLWTTTALDLWTVPGEDAKKLGEIEGTKRILVTGREAAGRVEIVLDGKARWVTRGYLSEDKPVAGPAGLGGACTNGTSVSSGVSPNVVQVHAAVCAAFPEITTYGTFRGDGEHAQGLAVDIMVSGGRGWEVAEFVRAHYAALGVSYLIYSQNIWSVERGGEGWRGMSDRGSTTANHYDHVHVTTY